MAAGNCKLMLFTMCIGLEPVEGHIIGDIDSSPYKEMSAKNKPKLADLQTEVKQRATLHKEQETSKSAQTPVPTNWSKPQCTKWLQDNHPITNPMDCRHRAPVRQCSCHQHVNCCRLLEGQASLEGKNSNKTWTQKSQEAFDATKKELTAFIKKQLKSMVCDLASVDKKHKANKLDLDEGECLLLKALRGELDGFNYNEMEKLSIKEDDDEISV